jgi:hypothetical protein
MSSRKAKEFETYARDCVKLAKQDNVSRSVTALRARVGLPAAPDIDRADWLAAPLGV